PRVQGAELSLAVPDPAAELARWLSAGCRPVEVDVRRPSLDDLYRALAHRRQELPKETADAA
ncbi:ABC transporter ATP-binding protein, partial [Streptomyces sp. A7024]|nr:ABC transporter ATP-binding protein [Streptomyces coryli]